MGAASRAFLFWSVSTEGLLLFPALDICSSPEVSSCACSVSGVPAACAVAAWDKLLAYFTGLSCSFLGTVFAWMNEVIIDFISNMSLFNPPMSLALETICSLIWT